MEDKKKFRDDQIFDIITGFYPEIAASAHRKKGYGKGNTGQKLIRKRGFSRQTYERMRTMDFREAHGLGALFEGTEGFEDTKGTVRGAKGTTMEDKKLWTRRKGVKDDPERIWYKFTGGGDNYKLYGDTVWYMHGVRDKKKLLTDYLNADQFSDKTPNFANMYSNKEKDLIVAAKRMAEEIFELAEGEIKDEIEKKSVAGTPMSAEEMGRSEGDFRYMSHADALAEAEATGNEELKEQLLTPEMSMAQPRDLYKIVGQGKQATVELSQDVTEQPIDQKGQHGITKVPDELKDAIAQVRAGEEGNDVKNAPGLASLKQAVINMYTSAIKEDYNPPIRKLKKIAGIEGEDVGNAKWDDVLRSLAGYAGKNTSSKQGVQTMGAALGVEIQKFGLMKTSKKKGAQTAIELIAHVLGTMNEGVNSQYKQTHRVHTYKPSGMSVYATVPLAPHPDTWLFQEKLVNKNTVGIITGYNATMATKEKQDSAQRKLNLVTAKGQKHNFASTKVTGMTCNNLGATSATATMGVHKGLRPTTVVHIPATGDLEKALIKDIKNGIPDIGDRLGRGASGKLQQRTYGLGDRRQGLKAPADLDKTQFWALPYIGVLQSEFIEK